MAVAACGVPCGGSIAAKSTFAGVALLLASDDPRLRRNAGDAVGMPDVFVPRLDESGMATTGWSQSYTLPPRTATAGDRVKQQVASGNSLKKFPDSPTGRDGKAAC